MKPAADARCGVAVTGASGFVGRRLLIRLRDEGCSPLAFSRAGVGLPGIRERVVRDYADMAAMVPALHGTEAMVHLAGRAHRRSAGAQDAALFRQANVVSTIAVAQACIAAGVRRLVFVSSIGVYGIPVTGRPFTASDPPRPAEPYASSKWDAERELAALAAASRLEVVVLRPPLIYGPGCPGNFASLLRLVARAPIVPLGGLRAPRSFIHIDNLVDALIVAARHPHVAGETYPVADGRDISVAEVVHELASVLRPAGSPVRNVAPWLLSLLATLVGKRSALAKVSASLRVDSSAFIRATGWQPRVDPAVGLRETARQFRSARSAASIREPEPS